MEFLSSQPTFFTTQTPGGPSHLVDIGPHYWTLIIRRPFFGVACIFHYHHEALLKPNNMKNLIKPAMILVLIFLALPSQATITPAISIPSEWKEMQANFYTKRLLEIKAMDKSSLSATQKKALRNEVKEIKQVQRSSGGVFLSLGAVIIIVLLLIILL